jgi:hypothetical protein
MPDTTILSNYDRIINELKKEGKVQEKTPSESQAILDTIENELEQFRFDNQKKAQASEQEMATLYLTA